LVGFTESVFEEPYIFLFLVQASFATEQVAPLFVLNAQVDEEEHESMNS